MAKMVMEIAYKYQFQIMSEIQNMKQILKWDGNGYYAQVYFPYEPILPSSNLMVLNHTVYHCEH